MNKTLTTPRPARPSVSIGDLDTMRQKAHSVVVETRAAAAAPSASKPAPTFTSAQVADLCGLDRSAFENRRKKGGLPIGIGNESRRRLFTLRETQLWVEEHRKSKSKRGCLPKGSKLPNAVVISVANFKGGVSKTTTAATLAQGLSLRGHTVLVIDLDPQGSLTSLFGIAPESLVDSETVLSIVTGQESSIGESIKPTYWFNIHIVGANPRISGSQAYLPDQGEKGSKKFWTTISDSIDADMRAMYDVIIIDTPPSLDWLTIGGLYASDVLIVPLPPSAMDFVSSANFFDVFVDLFQDLGVVKDFSFVDILMSRVDSNDSSSAIVREWITEAYGKCVLPIEIPTSASTKNASLEFGTVYDINSAKDSAKTHQRAYQAYERFVEIIEDQLIRIWQSN